jgi:hypothetical protein
MNRFADINTTYEVALLFGLAHYRSSFVFFIVRLGWGEGGRRRRMVPRLAGAIRAVNVKTEGRD